MIIVHDKDGYMQTFFNDEAKSLGVPAAVILSRCRYIHSQLVKEKRTVGGEYWIHRSNSAWQAEFPFWTRPTIKRALSKLVEAGLIERAPKHLPCPGDYRSFYKVGKLLAKGGTNLSKGGTESTHIYKETITTPIAKQEWVRNLPPTLEEVKKYFKEEGYTSDGAKKAFDYYDQRNWLDKFGRPVKDWKATMQRVWFQDDNRAKHDTLSKYGI